MARTLVTGDQVKNSSITGADLDATGSYTMGDLNVGEYIYHADDTDTYIRFQADSINIYTGGRSMLKLEEASQDKVMLNNGGMDVDIQIKGESDNNLIRTVASDDRVGIGTSSPACLLDVAGGFAASGPSKTFQTFASGDYTPSVANGNLFKTYDGFSQGATSLDDGVAGQIVTIISTNSFTYMASGGNLKAGTTDIPTNDGDVTTWVYDGTYWYLMNFMDQSADLSGGH